MRRAAAGVVAWLALLPVAAAQTVLVLPASEGSQRLRLELSLDGQSPEKEWGEFIDRLVAFYDRDDNGALSREEATRVMPLPLAERREVKLAWDELDGNRDGRATRDELRDHLRRAGFTPVVAVTDGPSADDLRLAALWRRELALDRALGAPGANARHPTELLRRYDADENEFLELRELLAAETSPVAEEKDEPPVVTTGEGEAELRVELGRNPAASLAGAGAAAIKLKVDAMAGRRARLSGPGAEWSATIIPARRAINVEAACEFFLSQFQEALGKRAALSTADIEQDLALSALVELVTPADRNADGQLSLAELREYFDLVAAGTRAQVWVTLRSHGCNPLPALDADADERLSYRELAGAERKFGVTNGNRLSRQFELSFSGPLVKSWGGVMLPAAKRRTVRNANTLGNGAPVPRWFEASDRNRDGAISPHEYLGSPRSFQKLDANGDGVVTPDETPRP